MMKLSLVVVVIVVISKLYCETYDANQYKQNVIIVVVKQINIKLFVYSFFSQIHQETNE